MERDRTLHILRWVITPIVLALIAGYFQLRVTTIAGQTRASYDTLAPSVLELQDKVAVLTGRVEELTRRPVLVFPDPAKPVSKPAPAPAPPKPVGEIGGWKGLGGKTELMMDAPSAAPKKVPAKFEDMIQQAR